MIIYLDSSALVKRYVAEFRSSEVSALISEAEALGTSVISRAEVVAALSKASRTRVLTRAAAAEALSAFMGDWDSIIRVQLRESLCSRAALVAWEMGLRGYDAVHLATALFWSEQLGSKVTLATFDRGLWKATQASGILRWPEKL